ncbi:HAD-IIIC family phosphatase [Verrucomicrobia bacterium]|nr:HAD-IIIC family phosphatase [Verrucomicrobiota bacterium]
MDVKRIKNVYRLSPLQEGILFHNLESKDSSAYFEQLTFTIHGPLSLETLQTAWQKTLQCHDSLRTIFAYQKLKEPIQVVLKETHFKVKIIDLSHVGEGSKNGEYNNVLKDDRKNLFNLDKEVSIRFCLVKISEEEFKCILSVHHILMDGWSIGIIYEELFDNYASIKNGSFKTPTNIPQYSSFIKYLSKKSSSESKNFWSKELKTISQNELTRFNNGPNRSSGFDTSFYAEELSASATKELTEMLRGHGVTLGSFLYTIWAVLLASKSEEKNTVRNVAFLTTVSGRPACIPEVSRIVGLFINAIPSIVQIDFQKTLIDVVKSVHESNARSQDHHFCSLTEILKNEGISANMFDHIVVIENHSGEQSSRTMGDGDLEITNMQMHDHTNYPLTLQLHPNEKLKFHYIYNKNYLAEEKVKKIQSFLSSIISCCLDNPGKLLREYTIESGPKNNPLVYSQVNDPKILIGSTFTCDPLIPYLKFCLNSTCLTHEILCCGYNQVLETLTRKEGIQKLNHGCLLLLIRVEDWIYENDKDDLERTKTALDYYLKTWISAVADLPPDLEVIIPTFTYEKPGHLNEEIAEHLIQTENVWNRFIDENTNITNLDFRKFDKSFVGTDINDPNSYKNAHIPYTEHAYAYMANAITKLKYNDSKRQSIKVICVDLDNTLWNGVCGEGSANVTVEKGNQYLQKWLLNKKESGYLLAICSKNNLEDVINTFKTTQNMVLKYDDFISHKINWVEKSQNIKELGKELNLGLKSFILLDDNPSECLEVSSNCADTVCFNLPGRSELFPEFLGYLWGLDTEKLTQADKTRNQSYSTEVKRQKIAAQSNKQEFIRGLNLAVKVFQVSDVEKENRVEINNRINQLHKRVNQFRINTGSITSPNNHSSTSNWCCNFISVEDKFGDYGITGYLSYRIENDTIQINSFLLSCRVLGRGVEDSILKYLYTKCSVKNVSKIKFNFENTGRNEAAITFLSRNNFNDTNNYTVKAKHCPPWPEFLPQVNDNENFRFVHKTSKNISGKKSNINDTHVHGRSSVNKNCLVNNALVKNKKKPGPYFPFIFNTADKIYDSVHGASPLLDSTMDGLSPVQKEIAIIWHDLIGHGSFDLDTEFYDAGGHSLKVVRLAGQLSKKFNCDISVTDLLTFPTIKEQETLICQDKPNELAKLKKHKVQTHYPLTPSQLRLWIIKETDPESASYNNNVCNVLQGEIDLNLLKESYKGLINKHVSLRTFFTEIEGQPKQACSDHFTLDFQQSELIRDSVHHQDVVNELRKLGAQNFDLKKGPLHKMHLLRTGKKTHVLLFSIHHIITDGWSLNILFSDLITDYGILIAEEKLVSTKPKFDYFDYTLWLEQNESNYVGLNYWKSLLTGCKSKVEFTPNTQEENFRGIVSNTVINETGNDKGRTLARACTQHGCSKLNIMLAATNIVLNKLTGQQDINIGIPVSGRNHPDLHEITGLFVNSIVIRTTFDELMTIDDLIQNTKNQLIQSGKHQDIPFNEVVHELGPNTSNAETPLFNVLVTHDDTELKIVGKNYTAIPYGRNIDVNGRFDLTIILHTSEDHCSTELIGNKDFFSPKLLDEVNQCMDKAISKISTHANQQITRTSITSSNWDKKVFDDLNYKTRHFIKNPSIIEEFQKIVKKFPAQICHVYHDSKHGDKKLSYSQIYERVEQIASYLIREANVQPGDVVGVVCREQTCVPELILAIIRVKAVYLPIDPKLPLKRIQFMLHDSSCSKVIDSDDAYKNLGFDIISISGETGHEEDVLPDVNADVNRPIYIIYTSGSTGQPKGALIKETGFTLMIQSQIKRFGVNEKKRHLQFASCSFDASMSEIFMALLTGGQIHKYSLEEHLDPDRLCESFLKDQIQVGTFPPSYLTQISNNKLDSFEIIITAGEHAKPSDLNKLLATTRIFNAYGPTEASVCSTIHEVSEEDKNALRIPIGKSLEFTKVVILDQDLNICPPWVVGQLAISGPGLMAHYINQPSLTEKVLIRWKNGIKLYLTGDYGYSDNNLKITFIGRKDDQIKHRGYRIELNEINNLIQSIDGIRQSATYLIDNKNQSTLCTALVTRTELDIQQVKTFLHTKLPEYMLPSEYYIIKKIPLTINGKVDYEKLKRLRPEAKIPLLITGNISENTSLKALVSVLTETLGNKGIGPDSDFFEIGGDSIKSIEVSRKLKTLGHLLPVKDIYFNPKIREMATKMQALADRKNQGKQTTVEFSPTQINMLLKQEEHTVENVFKLDSFYNNLYIEVTHPFTTAKLMEAIKEIVAAHPMLRLDFKHVHRNDIFGKINDNQEIFVEKKISLHSDLNLDESCALEIGGFLKDISKKQAQPINVLLMEYPDGARALISINSFVIDSISWSIIAEQLKTAAHSVNQGKFYNGDSAKNGTQVNYREILTDEYYDRVFREKAYWEEQTNYPDNKFLNSSLSQRATKNREIFTASFDTCKEAHKFTYHDQVIALALVLKTLTNDDNVTVQMEHNGRALFENNHDLSDLVGWFSAFHPLKIPVLSGDYPHDKLEELKIRLINLPSKGINYQPLQNKLIQQGENSMSNSHVEPAIGFNFLGTNYSDEDHLGIKKINYDAKLTDSDQRFMLRDLMLTTYRDEKSFSLKVSYNCARFKKELIQRFTQAFLQQLKKIGSPLNCPLPLKDSANTFVTILKNTEYCSEKIFKRLNLWPYTTANINDEKVARSLEEYLNKPFEDPLDVLIKLFLLCQEVESRKVHEIFPSHLVRGLQESNILLNKGNCLKSQFAFWEVKELIVATDPLFSSNTVNKVMPLFPESYELCDSIPIFNYDRCLDLCTGSGVIGLYTSTFSQNVTYLDNNDRAIEFAKFNARLNNIKNCSIISGDLLNTECGVAFDAFDLITANPPYLPSHDNEVGKNYYAGGQSGQKFVEIITQQINLKLKTQGQCFICHLLSVSKEDSLETVFRNLFSVNEKIRISVYGTHYAGSRIRTKNGQTAKFCITKLFRT